MKKIFCISIVLLISVGLFANGLSLNSIGPKALGMGGAFVGLANDPSAIYWNPAGLTGQGNGIHISVADIIPMANYDMVTYGIEAEAEQNHYISPNLFVNYNMGKFAFGLGAYVPAGVGTEWDGADLVAFNGPPAFDPGGNFPNQFAGIAFEWMTKIGVFDISPAVSYAFSDQFSIGVAANIYYGMLELKRGTDFFGYDLNPTSPTFGTAFIGVEDGMLDTQQAIDITGLGYGGALGIMYKPNDVFSLGLSYRSPVNVAFEGDAEFDITGLDKIDTEMDIEWPTWIGGGIAFKASDKLTLTADAQYTNWAALEQIDVTLMFPATFGGEKEEEMLLEWNDKTQLRLGLEYMMKPSLALRTGWYHDPAPSPDETLTILFPSGTYSALTGGFSYMMGKLNVDFGAEYLFGAERNVTAAPDNMPGKHHVDIFAASLGIGYKF